MSEIKYDAFISYRHADLDSFVAKSLHRMLENFRIPKLADKEVQKKAKRRINRIFRDQDELPVSNNLADSIKLALEASEYLIVICSPRTPESLWVRKEIESFIQLHGSKNVLAVLIEGEPMDSFPPELRQINVQKTDENGQLYWTKEDIEPLAADVRGASKKQVFRLLKKEVLRLVAPILGCSYDDLKQRHKEQRLKRVITFFAAAATVLLAFGGFSTYQAVRISKQADIISQKSIALEEENNNNKILQSKSLAKQALELYAQGDRAMGTLLAMYALPTNLNAPERPYVTEAQEALTQTLQVYETGSYYKPYCLLTQEANMKFVCTSPSGETVAALDEAGNLSVWNLENGKLLFTQKTNGSVIQAKTFQYLTDEILVYGSDKAFLAIDVATGQVKYTLEGFYITDMAVCADKMLVAFSDNYCIYVYDVTSGSIVFVYDGESYYSIMNGLSLSPNGRYLSVGLFADNELDTPAGIVQIDLETAEEVVCTELAYNWITEAQIDNDGTCYLWNKDISGNRSFLANGPEILYGIGIDGIPKWTYESENTMAHDLSLDGNELYSITESNLLVISALTGKCVNQIGYSNMLLGYQVINDGESLYAYMQDGKLQRTDFDDLANPVTFLQTESGYAKYMDVCDENVLVQTNDKNLCFYKAGRGAKVKELGTSDGYVMYSELSQDSKKLIVADFTFTGESNVYTYSTEDGKLLWKQKLEDTTGVCGIFSCADGKHVAVESYSSVYILDWESGELIYQWTEEEEGTKGSVIVDDAHTVMYIFSFDKCEIFDLSDFKKIGEASHTEYYVNGFAGSRANQVLAMDAYGNGMVIEIGEDNTTSTLDWQATQFDYCGVTDCYLIANTLTNEIQLYNAQDHTVLQSMEQNTASVEQLQFAPNGDKFYVQDLNHTIKIYDTQSFRLLKRITNPSAKMGEWRQSRDGSIQILLDDDIYHTNGYLLNEDMDIIATVPYLWEVNGEGNQMIAIVGQSIYEFPVYSMESLCEEAHSQLQGRCMTTEEKEQYFVE